MQHPDEGTIHAWLDGQLSPEEGAAVESHARDCASCAATIAEARGLVAASSRIVSALDTVPGGVIPGSVKPATSRRRAWYTGTQLRAAAAVLFVAAASMLVLRDQGPTPSGKSSSRPLIVTDSKASEPLDGTSSQPTATANAAVPQAAVTADPATQGAKTSAPSSAPSPATASGRALGRTEAIQSAPQRDAAGKVVTNEQDFSGRGVVPSPADQRSLENRAAFGAALREKSAATVGAAAAPAAAKEELALVRADTTGDSRVRVYRVAEGVEVTLTETMPAPLTTETVRRRESSQAQSTRPAGPPAPPPPPPSVGRRDSIEPLPVVSITWIDPATKRTLTLSGRLPRERLDQLRKEIEQRQR